MSAIHQQMKATLAATGIPYREIECYGSQIVITSQSLETANKWGSVLSSFAKVRGVVKALDERKAEIEYRYDRSTMRNKYVQVWRTFAAIQ